MNNTREQSERRGLLAFLFPTNETGEATIASNVPPYYGDSALLVTGDCILSI